MAGSAAGRVGHPQTGVPGGVSEAMSEGRLCDTSARRCVTLGGAGIRYRERLAQTATMHQAVVDTDRVLRRPHAVAALKTDREAVGIQVVARDVHPRRKSHPLCQRRGRDGRNLARSFDTAHERQGVSRAQVSPGQPHYAAPSPTPRPITLRLSAQSPNVYQPPNDAHCVLRGRQSWHCLAARGRDARPHHLQAGIGEDVGQWDEPGRPRHPLIPRRCGDRQPRAGRGPTAPAHDGHEAGPASSRCGPYAHSQVCQIKGGSHMLLLGTPKR